MELICDNQVALHLEVLGSTIHVTKHPEETRKPRYPLLESPQNDHGWGLKVPGWLLKVISSVLWKNSGETVSHTPSLANTCGLWQRASSGSG